MTLFHDSHDPAYRLPFGAAECGQTISLSLKAPEADYALLRLYTDEEGEKVLQPNGADNGIFFWSFEAPGDDVVLWYFFVAGIGDNVYCLGDNDDSLGGEGKVYYQGETPKSFRISVYHPFSVPDWYKEGIVYQIYPDRFARAESDPPLKETGRALGRKTEDWDTPPYYIRKEDGSIAQWNFWGGTLKGIESRLPYIRSLGASVIYLNPIFKARSNHRYDTADYFETDPMLGTEEDFRSLCGKASELGIRIILDGVFNHTGCDSDYFRLHKDWYLKDEDGSVKCWWGVKDLPEIDESNEEFRELICGENGVIRYWLRAGASGWRLDVADELPNDFLMLIRRAVKAEGDDKLVIGEVWEDASYKYDYGARIKAAQTPEGVCVTATAFLCDETHKRMPGDGACGIGYTFTPEAVTVNGRVSPDIGARFVLPVSGNAAVEILRGTAAGEPGAIFSMSPGFIGQEYVIRPDDEGRFTVKIRPKEEKA